MIKKKNAETKFGHVDHTKISLDKKYKMETTPFQFFLLFFTFSLLSFLSYNKKMDI